MLGWFGGSPSGGTQAGTERNGFGGGGNGGSGDKYSLKTLQDLYAALAKNQDVTSYNQETLVETVRAISEVIVYGDQHTEQLFDYFCEKNMFPLLLGLLDQPNCGTRLKIQIIQSVSILVQNIRSETSLYYTLSNNHVNRLITHPFNFANEETLGHYISFLKTLSLKLNHKTIQFFFNDRLNSFPLYEEAIKFYDHPEGMVRTAVRTITLNVFRVQDEMMYSWLLEGGASATYVEQVVRFIHRRCRRLHLLVSHGANLVENEQDGNTLLRRTSSHSSASSAMNQSVKQENKKLLDKKRAFHSLLLRLEVGLTEQQDHLLYLEDILSLKVRGMESIVVDSSMAYMFLPLLIASLLPQTMPFGEIEDLSEQDFIEVGLRKSNPPRDESGDSGSLLSLFLLSHALFWFSSPVVLNRLVEAIFLPVGTDPLENEEDKEGSLFPEIAALKEKDGDVNEDEDGDDDDDNDETDTDGASSLVESSQQELPDPVHGIQRRASSSSTSSRSLNGPGSGNPLRRAFFGFLNHHNERHCLAAACMVYALINNENIDPELLEQIGFAPKRHFHSEEMEEDGEEDGQVDVCADVNADSDSEAKLEKEGGPGDHGSTETEEEEEEEEEESQQDEQENIDNYDDDEKNKNKNKEKEKEEDQKPKTEGKKTYMYPKEIVGALLKVLMRDPPICTLAQRVIAKLIIDLVFIEEESGSCLTEEHAKMLDQAYMGCVQRFKKQLECQVHKANPARLVEIVEMEWVNLCEGPLKVESLMTMPQVFLSVDVGKGSKVDKNDFPLDSRQPLSILENTRCCARSFMIMRLLWVTLNRKNNSLLASLVNVQASQQENQKIDLRKCDYIKVTVMNGNGSTAAMQPAFLVVAGSCLMIVEPDKTVLGIGIIRAVAPLQRTSFVQGHNDELVMHIIVRSHQKIGWAHKQLKPLASNSASLSPEILNPLAEHVGSQLDSSGNDISKIPEPPVQYPWSWSQDQYLVNQGLNAASNEDLRSVPTWHITIRHEDHASAFWARDQLDRAINATLKAKLKRIRRIISAREKNV